MEVSWSTLGKAVASVAPTLAGALGGPVGAVAGAAGNLLCEVLGVSSAEQAEAALRNNPDAVIKLREIEAKEKDKLLEWQSTQLCAELDNVKSAREREIELAKAGSKATWSTSIVSFVVTVGFFVMLGIVMVKGEAKVGSAGLMLLGTLSTAFGAVINYYLGSSLGSANKEKMLNGGKS